MSESTRLIKRYYHSIKSINLRTMVDQVDSVTALLSELFDADFLALYYKKEGNETLIPVGYHNKGVIVSPDIDKIEKEYCSKNNHTSHFVPGLLCFDENQNQSTDIFAKENKLKYLYQFPHYENNDISILILAYWHEQPNLDEPKLQKLVLSIVKILTIILNSIDEHKTSNDYTIRLSDLIALFEIDISILSYSELVQKLVLKLKDIIPCGYLTFSADISHKCNFTEALNIEKPNDHFIRTMEKELSDFSIELNDVENQNGIWVDFNGKLKSFFKTILASPICINKDQTTFLVYVSDQNNPLSDNDKELLSLFSLFSSLILQASFLLESEKRVNKLLKKTNSKQADIETLAALSDLTSGIAHEFNNMIGGVVGRVQLLKLKVQDSEIVKQLDKIEMIAQGGAETVKRIQEFAMGSKFKQTNSFDLASLVVNCVENRNPNWHSVSQSKNIKVNSDLTIDNAFINGVYDDVLLALENIILNGVECADDNSTVLIQLQENNTHFVINIHNVGQVINQSELKRIFYPFFTKKDSYGAGMGLSIVHGIVTRHGGKISVTSSDDDGTNFKMEFLKTDAVEDETEISRKIKTERQLKILIVDDDDQIREVLTDMLLIDGFETKGCEDGYSALKAFSEEDFDLVITDLGMPGMSGLELADEIHSQKPHVPIAMITGWGTQLNQDEIGLKGIKKVMSKPFHLKDIKAMIQDLVSEAST